MLQWQSYYHIQMDQISTLYMLNNGFMINTICIFILKIGIRSFESTHLLFFQLKKTV